MSSPVRLLLLSGTPGADTSAVAAAACDELSRSGHVARLIRPGDPASKDAYQSMWSMLADGVGAILVSLGVASLSLDEVGTLPGLEDLATALAACEAAEEAGAHVVWDAGPGDSALRSVSSVGAALLLLERLLTPQTTARVHSQDGSPLGAVAGLQARLLAAEARLASSTVSWIVAGPTPEAQLAARRATAGLGLWEIPVEGVVEDQGSDGTQERRLADPWTHPREQMRWVVEAPEGYLLRIRLPMVDRDSLRVGRAGANLVLGIDEWRRVIRLPAALQRCVVDGADLVEGLLTVRLHPDPLAWPRRAFTEDGDLR